MDQSDCIDFGILAILEGLLTRIFYMLCLMYYIQSKPVYEGQPRGITKVVFADRWPLFRKSETTFQFSQDELRQETTTHRCPYAQV